MLRVRCPGPSIEAAEQWLLRFVEPWDEEDWSSGVSCVLHQRWREYPLVSASARGVEQITERIGKPGNVSDRWFAGSRFVIICSQPRRLLTYARAATEVVRCLPDVRIVGPAVVEEPR